MKPTDTRQREEMYTIAREYSMNFKGLRKIMVRFRPAICPFDDVFQHVPFEGTGFDIGCGAGFTLFAQAKLRRATDLVGVDVNQDLATHSTAVLRNAAPDTGFTILTTNSCADWPTRTFDIVTMIDVLHHIPVEHQLQFVKAAAARVRPGGTLIYKDMSAKPTLHGLANRLHDLIFARQWINYVPIEAIANSLSEIGFTIDARSDRKMLWYSHQMLVVKLPH